MTVSSDLQHFLFRRLIGKIDSDVRAAGLVVKAADTGRVLMLQRSYADPSDPAKGKWEWPGGHVRPGEDSQDAAIREWEEETGQKLPAGRHAGSWTSPNGYRGHVYVVPSEAQVPVGALRKGKISNPADPDHSEAVAFHDIRHIALNPAVRGEVRRHTDWSVLHQKPLPSDKEAAQQWGIGAPGPGRDRSPLHTGPQGPATPQAPDAQPGERFPEGYVTVQPANKKLHVLLADSPARRSIGLQNTPDLANSEYDGMLFVWPGDANASFHNRNVSHPVGATWFDSSGMYVDHAHMLADDPTPKTPRAAHRYALEVHDDKMDSFGLGPGSSMDMHQDKNDSVQMGDGTTNAQVR